MAQRPSPDGSADTLGPATVEGTSISARPDDAACRGTVALRRWGREHSKRTAKAERSGVRAAPDSDGAAILKVHSALGELKQHAKALRGAAKVLGETLSGPQGRRMAVEAADVEQLRKVVALAGEALDQAIEAVQPSVDGRSGEVA